MIFCLERNIETINRVIQEYEPNRGLTIFEGIRRTLPRDAFPSIEIEPTSGSNSWFTTRAQMPRYSFQCIMTFLNDNETYGVEYPSTIATTVVEIMTNPRNLQLKVLNEQKWAPYVGWVDTYIVDSLVESVTYNANKDGTIRTVEFDWFAMIHEPFPESHWRLGDSSDEPTPVRSA